MSKKKKRINKKTNRKKKSVSEDVLETEHNKAPNKESEGALVEKNIQWTQIIYEQNKKIQRRLTFLVIGNYIRLLLVFIPIIIGILYLLPFFGQEMESSTSIRFLREGFGNMFGMDRLIDFFSKSQ
jgi:hypothetical protein